MATFLGTSRRRRSEVCVWTRALNESLRTLSVDEPARVDHQLC